MVSCVIKYSEYWFFELFFILCLNLNDLRLLFRKIQEFLFLFHCYCHLLSTSFNIELPNSIN